jgi:flagellar biosynthesis protein FlhB
MDPIYIWFPLVFGFLGFMFSSRPIILAFNSLNPIQGLIAYYTIIFLTLEMMQFVGLVIGGVAMSSPLQTLGETMILFAYFIIFDMTSAWVQYVVDEDMEKRGVKKNEKKQDKSTSLGQQPLECPNLYLQAEDGATFYTVSQFVKDKENVRYITFVAMPAILAFIGLILTRGKVSRTMFG